MPTLVPFVRFSRDKRGYEHLYLVQPGSQRRGRPGARVLYWFRTPPNIRVGRRAFDEFARRELERRYPDVSFDWEALASTPIPPPAPDVERWRERRRQDRAARQAARSGADSDVAAAAGPDQPVDESDGALTASEEVEATEPALPRSAAEAAIEAAQAGTEAAESDAGTSQEGNSSAPLGAEPPASGARNSRRRRRRRHRGSRGPQPPGPAGE